MEGLEVVGCAQAVRGESTRAVVDVEREGVTRRRRARGEVDVAVAIDVTGLRGAEAVRDWKGGVDRELTAAVVAEQQIGSGADADERIYIPVAVDVRELDGVREHVADRKVRGGHVDEAGPR